MPLTRANNIIKVNENDVIGDVGQRKNLLTRNKNSVTNVGRLALGEVSNNLVKAETAATKRTEPLKAVTNLKNVKPKVDSHWKKSEVPTAVPNVKRRNSQVSPPKLVTAKSVRFAKAEVPQLITIKADPQSKTNAVVTQKGPVRRQESILNRLRPVRNAVGQAAQASASSTARSVQSIDKTDEISHSNNMLIHGVDDIDENDAGKLNLESEYVKDIYCYLQELEKKFAVPDNYLANQKEVTPKMRTVLIDWLNEVHLQFHLFTETYYLTVGIIDRYLHAYPVTSRKNLQLVGVAAMFLACKYEEMYPPMLKDFVFITDDTYHAGQITGMEQHILKKLEFDMSAPSVIHFARRFSKAANTTQVEHTMTKYFIELASVEYSMVHYLPSQIAAAAVFMTLKLKSPFRNESKLWSANMKFYTKYELDDLRVVISKLANVVLNAPKAKEQAIYSKYSTNSFDKIALRTDIYGSTMLSLSCFDVKNL